ncbi:MAG: N-acetyltransferase [Pseudomonadota bacterium]
MDCFIRNARPSDAIAVAELMYSSGPELYDYLYQIGNTSAVDFINYQFPRDANFSSHQWHYVAEVNGIVAGVVECYDADQYKKMLWPQLKDILTFYPFLSWARLGRRLTHVGSVLSVPKASQTYIANLGIHPDYQGQGIGTQLIQYLEHQSEQLGYRSITLDVALNNPNAQRLYERLGFEVIKEGRFKGDASHNVPDARLMVKQIGNETLSHK